MDAKKLDQALNKIINMDSKQFENLQMAIERKQAKEEDERVFNESGIERLTIFLQDGNHALLVKPNPMLGGAWLINLFAVGTLNADKDAAVKFEVANIGSGCAFRLFVKSAGLSYWVDLIDEAQANDLAAFLGVEVHRS